MKPVVRMCGLGLLLMLSACGVGAMETVRTRHARQFQCAEQQVTVTELGGGAWIADGCGQRISYYCDDPNAHAASTGDAECIMESARSQAGTIPP